MAGNSKSAGAHSVVDRIGNTPLFRIQRLAAHLPNVEIYAKAEYFNPGGSVKDRPALGMILDGERRGKLTPDKVLIDSTSGNTGIAYAMIGAAKGYKIKLFLPAKRRQSATDPESLRRGNDSHESERGFRRSDSRMSKPSIAAARRSTSTPTNTATPPTGGRTTRRPARRSSPKPKTALPISSRVWELAARLWA